MKEVKAIVQPFLADRVIDSLREVAHLPGITVSSVNAFSRSDAGSEPSEHVEDAPMAKIEIVVPDEAVEMVIEIITHAAHTGRIGDGKIFVYELADTVNLRTGRRGEAAL